jgi:hypothetical protein
MGPSLICLGNPGSLLHHTEITMQGPLGNKNIFFTGVQSNLMPSFTNIGIGYSAGRVINPTLLKAKLDVINSTFAGSEAILSNKYAGRFINNGASNTAGSANTFVGAASGGSNLSGSNNCYIGCRTANFGSISTGSRNNYLGANSGSFEISGNDNQQIGFQSGFLNSVGSANILIGSNAGASVGSTNTENANIFIGHQAGQFFANGANNILLGANTVATNNINNAAAIGDGALVLHNNDFILGNNTQKIGIGLSGNALGPQAKLEINAAANTSGLRFRQLTNASPAIVNTTNNVLSVDNIGNVILVADQTAEIATLQAQVATLSQQVQALQKLLIKN